MPCRWAHACARPAPSMSQSTTNVRQPLDANDMPKAIVKLVLPSPGDGLVMAYDL